MICLLKEQLVVTDQAGPYPTPNTAILHLDALQLWGMSQKLETSEIKSQGIQT